MKNYIKIQLWLFVLSALLVTSCSDYLDVVPDNMATIDHAFRSRIETQNYLMGCYSYIPDNNNCDKNPYYFSSDEFCLFKGAERFNYKGWEIALGAQNTNNPYINYWEGKENGSPLYRGIRDCNIFLENVDRPFDLPEYEKKQWISEVKFLKAYYHYFLLKMYGPIPIIRENFPISADPKLVARKRESVDSVVSYIVQCIDEAMPNLLPMVEDMSQEQGRITQTIALALKAKVYVLAASPLFNGNEDYSSFKNSDGTNLFSSTYDPMKWQKAVDALKTVIDTCHIRGYQLHVFNPNIIANITEETKFGMGTRGAVTIRWNSEIIWGDSRGSSSNMQWAAQPGFAAEHGSGIIGSTLAPSLNIVNKFYTKNGLPIEEDKEWADVDLLEIKEIGDDLSINMKPGYETVASHFNREARFYGGLCFDGGKLYGNGKGNDDTKSISTRFRMGQPSAVVAATRYTASGYLPKKLLSYKTSLNTSKSQFSVYKYSWPIIRLSDLYLLYAEALNEVKGAPDQEVYEYIDLIRERSGLNGVVQSYTEKSNTPDKPFTKGGMREIIQRERTIELAFEGARGWDLRRWKTAETELNKPIRGWSVFESDADKFYVEENKYDIIFNKRDYLWPIRQNLLLKNSNLVQNPGW